MVKTGAVVLLIAGICWAAFAEAAAELPAEIQVGETRTYPARSLRIEDGKLWFYGACCDRVDLDLVRKLDSGDVEYAWQWAYDFTDVEKFRESDVISCTAVIGADVANPESSVQILQEFQAPTNGPFSIESQFALTEFSGINKVWIMPGAPIDIVETLLERRIPPQVPAGIFIGNAHQCLYTCRGVPHRTIERMGEGHYCWKAEISVSPDEYNSYLAKDRRVIVNFFDRDGWLIQSQNLEYESDWRKGVNPISGEITVGTRPASFIVWCVFTSDGG